MIMIGSQVLEWEGICLPAELSGTWEFTHWTWSVANDTSSASSLQRKPNLRWFGIFCPNDYPITRLDLSISVWIYLFYSADTNFQRNTTWSITHGRTFSSVTTKRIICVTIKTPALDDLKHKCHTFENDGTEWAIILIGATPADGHYHFVLKIFIVLQKEGVRQFQERPFPLLPFWMESASRSCTGSYAAHRCFIQAKVDCILCWLRLDGKLQT